MCSQDVHHTAASPAPCCCCLSEGLEQPLLLLMSFQRSRRHENAELWTGGYIHCLQKMVRAAPVAATVRADSACLARVTEMPFRIWSFSTVLTF